MPSFLQRSRVRRALLLVELIVIPIGLATLFYLLVNALPFVQLGDAIGVVVASFGIALLGYTLFALRLSQVLRAFAIPVGQGDVWRIHMMSLFYYFFLPAGIGYDLSKVARIAPHAGPHGTWHAAAAAATERVSGGLGMYALLLATLPFTTMADDSHIDWLMLPGWAWLPLVAAGVVAAWIGAAWGRRKGWYDPRPLVPATLVSGLAYLVIAGAIWFVAVSLDIPIAFPEVVVALAATLLLQLVPVNLLGVTLGEVAAVTVYLAFGLGRPEALLLTTVAYAHRLVPAMLGGLIEATRAWRVYRGTEPPDEPGWRIEPRPSRHTP